MTANTDRQRTHLTPRPMTRLAHSSYLSTVMRDVSRMTRHNAEQQVDSAQPVHTLNLASLFALTDPPP